MLNAPLPHEAAFLADDFPVEEDDFPLEEIVVGLLELLMTHEADKALHEKFAELGKNYSPHEMAKIYRRLADQTTKESQVRLARVAPLWGMLLNSGGAVYRREILFEGATLYRSAVQAEERAAMVCFTGIMNGMFMPNCRFLELIGKYPIDVVILQTEDGSFGQWNPGGARSFYDALRILKSMLAARGIHVKAFIGTSAGGGPAVIAAMLDGTTSAIMFGGRFYSPGRRIPLKRAGPAFEPLCACWQGPTPPIYSIFSGEMRVDIRNNRKLVTLLPHAKAYPIPKSDKHNAMATLAARQKLRAVIDLIAQAASGKTVNFDLVRTL